MQLLTEAKGTTISLQSPITFSSGIALIDFLSLLAQSKIEFAFY